MSGAVRLVANCSADSVGEPGALVDSIRTVIILEASGALLVSWEGDQAALDACKLPSACVVWC